MKVYQASIKVLIPFNTPLSGEDLVKKIKETMIFQLASLHPLTIWDNVSVKDYNDPIN